MLGKLSHKFGWTSFLVCGLIFTVAGCGNSQTSGDDSTIVSGNTSARDAWEKAKADGSLKNRVSKSAPDMQNRRGH